jgi:hypothetical protein
VGGTASRAAVIESGGREAWIAGAKFWEIEIAARLIESHTGGFDLVTRQIGDERD